MTSSIEAIHDWLTQANADIGAKGYKPCGVSFTMSDNHRYSIISHPDIPSEYRIADQNGWITISHYSDDLDDLFEGFQTRIDALEDPASNRVRQFQQQLSQLIDTARDIGIEEEIVNPLAALSQKLAANAITKQAA